MSAQSQILAENKGGGSRGATASRFQFLPLREVGVAGRELSFRHFSIVQYSSVFGMLSKRAVRMLLSSSFLRSNVMELSNYDHWVIAL